MPIAELVSKNYLTATFKLKWLINSIAPLHSAYVNVYNQMNIREILLVGFKFNF